MRLPAPLSRNKSNVYKNNFGHVLILAGSQRMIGAAALTSLAALRAGAGLVTIGIPKSLNLTIQKKIANEIMTLPLAETTQQSLSLSAFNQIKKLYKKFDVIAVGPGLGAHTSTQKLVLKIIKSSTVPLIVDADGLNALATSVHSLEMAKAAVILTPHPGEMARLTRKKTSEIEADRSTTAKAFAKKYKVTVLLKGHRTVVADKTGQIYINKTGNAAMATAGSGDVLTGVIAAFVGQGLSAFDAAKYGAYYHGLAGDKAIRTKSKLSLIATDLINSLPIVVKSK